MEGGSCGEGDDSTSRGGGAEVLVLIIGGVLRGKHKRNNYITPW